MVLPSSVVFYQQKYQLIQSVETNKVTLIDNLGTLTEVTVSETLEVIAAAPTEEDTNLRFLGVIFDTYKPSSSWGGLVKKNINMEALLHDLQSAFGMTALSDTYLFSHEVHAFTLSVRERHLDFSLSHNQPVTIEAIRDFLSTAFCGQSISIKYESQKRNFTLFNHIPNVTTFLI
jgi:hypothetical protein